MPRRFYKRLIPNPEKIRNSRALGLFSSLLHNPNLWHINRRSAALAFAIGVFIAFLPVPFQMFIAAGVAILLHANLPISVTLVFITNPVTMPPLYYLAYKIGAWLLNKPLQPFEFQLSWDWLVSQMDTIGQPFVLGCLVMGTLLSGLSYISIRILWRWSVVNKWQKRQQKRR